METIIEKYKEENGKVNEINSDIIRINYSINNIPKNCDKLILFGKKFVENNKFLCSIIINEKEQELCEFISFKLINDYINKNDNIIIFTRYFKMGYKKCI